MQTNCMHRYLGWGRVEKQEPCLTLSLAQDPYAVLCSTPRMLVTKVVVWNVVQNSAQYAEQCLLSRQCIAVGGKSRSHLRCNPLASTQITAEIALGQTGSHLKCKSLGFPPTSYITQTHSHGSAQSSWPHSAQHCRPAGQQEPLCYHIAGTS